MPDQDLPEPQDLYRRAVAHHVQGDLQTAVRHYLLVLIDDPGDLDAVHLLGVVSYQLETPHRAAKLLGRAVQANPAMPAFHSNFSLPLVDIGEYRQALRASKTALILDPGQGDAVVNHANALREFADFEAAERYGYRALAASPDLKSVYSGLAQVLYHQGRHEESRAMADRALILAPSHPRALYVSGIVRAALGAPQAENHLAAASRLKPRQLDYMMSLAGVHKFVEGDEWHVKYRQAEETLGDFPLGSRIHGHFALGKMYDDLGQHEAGFKHYLAGNTLRRETISFDDNIPLGMFARVREDFTPELMARKKGMGHTSSRPIWIVGMPRSGTTLVEQVLASHSQVHGGGELTIFPELLDDYDEPGRCTFPSNVPGLTPEQIADLGRRYVDHLDKINGDTRYITDKLPGNLPFVGLFLMALPNARVILVRRDLVDVCLSCFAHNFSSGLHYTYDLGQLGRFARSSRLLMDHWERVISPERLLTVRYEEFVADQANQTRRLLDFCDLTWEEQCLDFHKTRRAVRTASFAQVRKPIYKSSVGKWRPDEALIRPLLDGLKGPDP